MRGETKRERIDRRIRENLEADLNWGQSTGAATARLPEFAARQKQKHPDGVKKAPSVLEIPLDLIEPDPEQPRRIFDDEALDRLGETLKKRGQLQPARVVLDRDRQRYVILCGERRWRAARKVGLKTLVCVVLEERPSREEVLIDQLLENCAREDLAPLELTEALAELEKKGLGRRRIADETGLSKAAVDRWLTLHGQPSEIRALVAEGKLAPSTAYELRSLEAPKQVEMAFMAVEKHLSRDRVKEFISYGPETSGKPPERIKNQVAHGGPPGIDNGSSEDSEPIEVRVIGGQSPEVERNGTLPDSVGEEETVMAALDTAGGGLPSRPVKPIPGTRSGGPRGDHAAPARAGADMDAGPLSAPIPADPKVPALADAVPMPVAAWEEVSHGGGWYSLHVRLPDRRFGNFGLRSGESFERFVRWVLWSYRENYPPARGERVRIDDPGGPLDRRGGKVVEVQEAGVVVEFDHPTESVGVMRLVPFALVERLMREEVVDAAG